MTRCRNIKKPSLLFPSLAGVRGVDVGQNRIHGGDQNNKPVGRGRKQKANNSQLSTANNKAIEDLMSLPLNGPEEWLQECMRDPLDIAFSGFDHVVTGSSSQQL